MKYDNLSMLPEDAFKKDALGRIKLYGGGGGGGGDTYNPLKDKQYKQEKAYLDTLRADMARNNQKMTPEQIIAALSPLQQSVVSQQGQMPSVPDMSSWRAFNQPIAPIDRQTTIIPQPQMQPTGQFGYDPQMIMQLQKMLGSSSLLPSASNINPSNTGNIGGR